MKSVWPGLVGLVFIIAGAFYYDAHSEELVTRAVTAGIIASPATAGEEMARAGVPDVKDAAVVAPPTDDPSSATSLALTVK